MAGRSDTVPILLVAANSFVPLIVNQAKVVDYLGSGMRPRRACERIDVCQ